MEEDIGLFAVNGDVARGAGRHGVRRRRDILGNAVLLAGLGGFGRDGGVFSEVGVGDGEHWLLGRLDVPGVDVLDLDILARHGVPHNAAVLARLVGGNVVDGPAAAGQRGIVLDGLIAPLLVAIETLDELLDVGDAVAARVVGAGAGSRLGHAEDAVRIRYSVLVRSILRPVGLVQLVGSIYDDLGIGG